MIWTIELSAEVAKWFDKLSVDGSAEADEAFDRLEKLGHELHMPHARPLGGGLYELRFDCERKATRVTYIFDFDRRIITLTQFHKQRDNEKQQIKRARLKARRIELNGEKKP